MNIGVLSILQTFHQTGKKGIGVLIDPDNRNFGHLEKLLNICNEKTVNFLLIGGSLLNQGNLDETIAFVKARTQIPLVLFPGSTHQISAEADAILLLSLVSGRNPDLLIGKHVEAAFRLKASALEIIPTAYLLINGGKSTTASYISFTQPIPGDKPMIAAATALAAQQLGMGLIYLDAGSGAIETVSAEMIESVKLHTGLPIIVGGGLKSKTAIDRAFHAGADMVVLGNILEHNPDLLYDIV